MAITDKIHVLFFTFPRGKLFFSFYIQGCVFGREKKWASLLTPFSLVVFFLGFFYFFILFFGLVRTGIISLRRCNGMSW